MDVEWRLFLELIIMSLSERFQQSVDRKVKGADNRLRDAANYLRQELRDAVSKPGSPDAPSRPGEPPHRVTGTLYNSIQVSVSKGVATVGTYLNYAGFLDHGTSRMAPRPWFRETINRCRAQVNRIIFGK
jgi:phage gpG-like protein